jgi:hypothetical protein
MSLPKGQSQPSPEMLRKGVGAFSVAQPEKSNRQVASVESTGKATGHHFAATAKPRNNSNRPVSKPISSAGGHEDLQRTSSTGGQADGSSHYS